jgi:HSP20 family molecular chaperone IbpA
MKYVVTRRPYGVQSSLNHFDRIFNNFWSDYPTAASTKLPKVDIRENDKEYVLEAELPGYGEKDVDVNVEKHVLLISSVNEIKDVKEESVEKAEKVEKVNESFLIRERLTSSFQRSFVLPEGVSEDKIKGEFKNGILTLVIPKLPEKQPKKIEVKIAS